MYALVVLLNKSSPTKNTILQLARIARMGLAVPGFLPQSQKNARIVNSKLSKNMSIFDCLCTPSPPHDSWNSLQPSETQMPSSYQNHWGTVVQCGGRGGFPLCDIETCYSLCCVGVGSQRHVIGSRSVTAATKKLG